MDATPIPPGSRFGRIANRICAALVSAASVCALVGLGVALLVRRVPYRTPSNAVSLLPDEWPTWLRVLIFVASCELIALPLIVLPLACVMLFSPAKRAPWRAVPLATVGATVGWLTCTLPLVLTRTTPATNVLIAIGTFFGPALGALAAILALRKRDAPSV